MLRQSLTIFSQLEAQFHPLKERKGDMGQGIVTTASNF